MLNSLVDVIGALVAFADKHGECTLHPSALLTESEYDALKDLDTQLFAFCQLLGLPLPVLPQSEADVTGFFGNSKLPYILCTIHHPIEKVVGQPAQELVGSGMLLFPTAEWFHAMKSLQTLAVLVEKKRHDSSKGRSAKSKRGRPAGSKTQEQDCNLYSDWKAAHRETGMTKAEFLRERGLPERELASIERGRKHSKKKNPSGKK
jgi:hypothetical protein